MATAFQVQPAPAPMGTRRVVAHVVATVGIVAVLAVAGITFVALAVAFPIAVHAVQEWGLPARASDLEVARRFAGFSWLFAVVGVASFAAALTTIVVVIRRVSPTVSE